jgi:hypothetical protein
LRVVRGRAECSAAYGTEAEPSSTGCDDTMANHSDSLNCFDFPKARLAPR